MPTIPTPRMPRPGLSMRRWRTALAACAVAACATATAGLTATTAAHAEPIDYFQVEGVRYDAAVPTPESAFGYGLGERPVRYAAMVDYLRDLAQRSDRITVETAGYSHEGRPILFFQVTSPDNHARLDEIKAAHLKRTDPDSRTIARDNPAVVWLNYGVHGAESSAMDAAIPMLYHLAAAEGDAIDAMLDRSVLLITAIFNPDGHSRRINHVWRYGSEVPVTDPAHQQHQLWGTARVNHYWFDLNRQWLLQTQPESQAWLAKWHEWKPQVTADYHEMGTNSTFYFHPGIPARINPLILPRTRELAVEIAKSHVGFLDSEAKLYFGEEGFDNFYIGKGSTYPQINGSVGFLFEIGAARGGQIESPNGLRTYADNIRTHFRTSLTTVEGAIAQRTELHRFQRDFFDSAVEAGRKDDRRAFVFAAPGDAARTYHFLDVLKRHDVRVHALAEDVTVDDTRYRAGEAYVVPLTQPQYRMIAGIFDTATEFEENVFYDVSGWTLPEAYDLAYAPLGRRFDDDLLGAPVDQPSFPSHDAPPVSSYGYMFEWTPYYAPRALYRFLDAGAIARTALRPVSVDTSDGVVDFERGAVFVPLARQSVSAERLHAIAATVAAEDGVRVHAVTSGRTPTPGADLGGRDSFKVVTKPSVLLLHDDGIANYDAGEVWYQLDYRMHMPVTLRKKDQLRGLDWDRYTHIILPGGYGVGLSDADTHRLKQWVVNGGTLVASRQGAQWAEDVFFPAKETDTSGEPTPEVEPFAYADLAIENARHVIGGALFATRVDITHPLGFGYLDGDLTSHRNTAETLRVPDSPIATVARYTDTPLVSGYASERRQSEIAGTPMMVHRRMGQGAVSLYADNPNFRATMLGTSKLFMNSLFFSTIVDRYRTPAEATAEADD